MVTLRVCALLSAAFVLKATYSVECSAGETSGTIAAEDLATLHDLGGLSISPDGEWVAMQVRTADPNSNSYVTAWQVVRTRGVEPIARVSNGGEPILLSFQGRLTGSMRVVPGATWSTDSRWLAYLRRDGGRTQIWRSRRDGWNAEQLTHSASDVRAFVYSRDGRLLLFETEPSREQVEAALAREGRSGFLYDRRFFPAHGPHPVTPRDVRFGGGAPISSRDQIAVRAIWSYELETRRERVATKTERAEFTELTATPRPEERPAFRANIAVSPAGALAWTEARDTDRQGYDPPLTLVAQPLSAQEPIVCRTAECTSRSFLDIWWRNENELIFARGEGARHQDTALYAWRPDEPAPRLLLRTSAKLVSPSNHEWRCAVGLDRLICLYEEANYPRRLVSVDLNSGDIQVLFDPNPNFARFELGPPPQRLEIRTASGVDAYGYLVLPPTHASGERLPLVVVTYRCDGFLRGGVGDEYPIFPLAAEGFAVLCFDVPPADDERRARDDADTYVRWSRGPGEPEKHRVQEALVAAIAQLDEMGVIDPNRIGLTGLSFGAETVHFALFNMPRLAAAIASGASFEPMDYYLYGPAGRDALRSWGLGAPDVTPERWRGLSLTPNAGRVRAPLLLNVADHEMLSVVAPVAALDDAGRAVEMYVYPDEYHIKWQPAHRLAIYNRNIDWMNFWLRGVEDSDPAKAEQYKRWRAMRENQCRLFTGEDAPWYCRTH